MYIYIITNPCLNFRYAVEKKHQDWQTFVFISEHRKVTFDFVRMATAPDIQWSDEVYTIKKLVDLPEKYYPLIVLVVEGYYGQDDIETLATNQVNQNLFTDIWRLWRQKHVSQAGISNYIPQCTVGCNYLSLSEIPASGAKVLIYTRGK